MTIDRKLARSRLDERFTQLRVLAGAPRPHRGWIRAIRDALGMSTNEMAQRMGVIQQNVFQLEKSEAEDRIQIRTLRQAADALNCDVVYALIPRTSLEDAVRTQARRKAQRVLDPVAHHSRLEDQSLSPHEMQAQLDELADNFIDSRGLWVEPHHGT
jgi:predicted DNA-binding mobile mystery protein A